MSGCRRSAGHTVLLCDPTSARRCDPPSGCDHGGGGLANEAHLAAGLLADQGANIVSAEPAPHAEGGHRAQRQPDDGIEEPHPFAEEIAPEDAGDLAGDGGNDDLKGLEGDEDDGREDAPLAKGLFEEEPVDVETDQELVRSVITSQTHYPARTATRVAPTRTQRRQAINLITA